MWWKKKKRINHLYAQLVLNDYDVTKDTKVTLEVGGVFSNNDMRITDTIENLGEMYNMLDDNMDISRTEFKVGKDGDITVVLCSIDDCLTFELKKTNAYKAYLERKVKE